jgi:hypothetical protein
MLPAREPTGDDLPFFITTGIETEIRPYVGISSMFLYWYLKIVSITITNDSEEPHSTITVCLTGSSEAQGCEAIEETYFVPYLGPHDTDTRIFHYKHKQDCPYSLSGKIISYQCETRNLTGRFMDKEKWEIPWWLK